MTKTKRPLPQLLFGKDREVACWVSERLPITGMAFDEKAVAIGVVSNDKLIAGVVYTDYQPEQETMQLHIASSNPMWARTETIRALLSYPFQELGVFKCWVSAMAGNERSLKLTDHIGFKREATLSHQFGKGCHAVISRMFKPDFVRIYHG